MTLGEFLRHHTAATELCVIREDGWIRLTCWIDYEDIWVIPREYYTKPVIREFWGVLDVTTADRRTVQVPCHYIDV